MVAALALALASPATLVLKGLDPIDLIEGREVPGRETLSETVGRHLYRFSSAEHKYRFGKEPYRYAVQNGGACGKMGALSGAGSPDRWAVVEGRIFLFASDGCRETFLGNLQAYLRQVPPPPASKPDQAKAARVLHTAMLAAHGGAEALGKLKSLHWVYEIPYKEAGVAKIWLTHAAYLGPERYAQWEQWDAGRSFLVQQWAVAREGRPGDVARMHPGEQRALRAALLRTPAGILLGAAKPIAPLDGGGGFVMADGDVAVEVRLDPATSRLASIAFTDHYRGPVVDVEIEFSDYRVVEGVALPDTHRVKVAGGEWGKPSTVARWEANGPEPEVFADARSG